LRSELYGRLDGRLDLVPNSHMPSGRTKGASAEIEAHQAALTLFGMLRPGVGFGDWKTGWRPNTVATIGCGAAVPRG
jgi:hypothetical protein